MNKRRSVEVWGKPENFAVAAVRERLGVARAACYYHPRAVGYAVRLETRIHREPGEGGYGRAEDFSATAMLTPLLLPSLALRLTDLPAE